MRIIGGRKQRLQIHAPKGLPVRPTTDKTKESIFNILNNWFDFEEVEVLDLFSGTGNMSYEFASRECVQVTAVEENPKAVQFIRDTARKHDFDNLEVVKADVFTFLRKGLSGYDLIFADPPYDMEEITRIHDFVFENNLLKPGGWLMIEHSKTTDFSTYNYYSDVRKYGRTMVSIFKLPEE